VLKSYYAVKGGAKVEGIILEPAPRTTFGPTEGGGLGLWLLLLRNCPMDRDLFMLNGNEDGISSRAALSRFAKLGGI